MFTMEQIRNMVFALMDQSTLNDRVSLNESRYVSVYETGLRLADMDETIKISTNDMHEKISNEVARFKEEFEALKIENKRDFYNHKSLITVNRDNFTKCKEELNDHKHQLGTQLEQINKQESRATKMINQLSNDIGTLKEEIEGRLDKNDKFYLE